MKRALFWLVLIAVIVAWRYEPRAHWRGMPAAHEPWQTTDNLPPPFRSGAVTITPLARYQITAVVLSRDRYLFDQSADIAPVDLALGWGPMSVAGTINELKFSQSGRWYFYQWNGEPPLETAAIVSHSANTHCLPADAKVRRKLLNVSRHDLVTMEGFLVEVHRDNGNVWRSSLTRDDSGGGACEVFWITKIDAHSL
ncbi:MAG TPA: hypothetical protein VFT72_03370 [Opitutaceae bacterium]|nr:hypothetical protein [Opitutaceae bacterium]